MATYPNGLEMRIGDRVLLYHGAEPAEIEAVLESPESHIAFGLSEPGISFRTSNFGLVLERMTSLQNSGDVEFVSRCS